MARLTEIQLAPSDADIHSGTGQVTGLSVQPSGRPGDLWVASYLTVGGTGAAHQAPDTSWSLIGSTGDINSTLALSVWAKRAIIGTFPIPFTHTGSLRAALSVRSFGNALAVEGTPGVGGAGGVTSHTHTAQTALDADRLWVLVTAKNTAGGVTTTINTPSGFSETSDICSAHATNPNANLSVHHKIVPAGSTGTQVVDSSDGAARTWAGVGFLLKPRNMRRPR